MTNPVNDERPPSVWVISCFFFLKTAGALLSLALITLLLSGVISISDAQRRHFESQIPRTDFVGLLSILINLCEFVGALFLFLLRQPALYCFGAGFVVSVVMWGYLINDMGWSAAMEDAGHLIKVFFGFSMCGAILIYVWYLSVSKILR